MSYIDRPCDACEHPFKDHHYVPEYGQAQCASCLHAQVVAPCEDYQDAGDWLATRGDTARIEVKYDL